MRGCSQPARPWAAKALRVAREVARADPRRLPGQELHRLAPREAQVPRRRRRGQEGGDRDHADGRPGHGERACSSAEDGHRREADGEGDPGAGRSAAQQPGREGERPRGGGDPPPAGDGPRSPCRDQEHQPGRGEEGLRRGNPRDERRRRTERRGCDEGGGQAPGPALDRAQEEERDRRPNHRPGVRRAEAGDRRPGGDDTEAEGDPEEAVGERDRGDRGARPPDRGGHGQGDDDPDPGEPRAQTRSGRVERRGSEPLGRRLHRDVSFGLRHRRFVDPSRVDPRGRGSRHGPARSASC